MSLVFDALRHIDAPGALVGDASKSSVATPPSRASTTRAWTVRSLLVLAAGLAGFMLAPRDSIGDAPVAGVQMQDVATVMPVAIDTTRTRDSQPSRAVDVVAGGPQAAVAVAAVPAKPLGESGAPAAPPPDAVAVKNIAPAVATTPQARVPMTPAAVAVVDSPTSDGSIDISVRTRDAAARDKAGTGQGRPANVAALVASVERAVDSGDDAAVDAALDRLETALPEKSLTLLRMRAWVLHARGDFAGAVQAYRDIVERVPDDENASINIAILDARNGHVGRARARLSSLSLQHAGSPLITRALAELDAME